jgi:hypothetical protein
VKDTNKLADRYMSLWNEPDRERRRRLVPELWTEDGAQISSRRRRCTRSQHARGLA